MDTETIETEATIETPLASENETARRPMRGTAIAWGVILLVAAAIAWVARGININELSPTALIWNVVIVGAVLVAIGIIGAIVRAVSNR